jgi:hypothetical protein
MKLSREDLKGIVKECLVEILSEGLTQSSTQINENRVSLKSTMQTQQKQVPRASVTDKISFLPKSTESVNSPRRTTVDKHVIRAATSDPVLQEMLADTAVRGTPILDESKVSSTMHESAIAVQGDIAAKHMLRSDPTDLFGEASTKWATLAFAEKKIGA